MVFDLAEAAPSDLDEIVDIHHRSMQNDFLYTSIFTQVPTEEQYKFFSLIFALRLEQPYCKTFKITDSESGKMVAWTGLDYPHKSTPEEEARKAEYLSRISVPEGSNAELASLFGGTLMRGLSNANGYNPEQDFRETPFIPMSSANNVLTSRATDRAGTRTLPEYQRQGLAWRLARHCAGIADEAGRRTFITARPAAIRLCEKTGFHEIARHEENMTKYGGAGIDISKCMLREPRDFAK